MMGGASLGSGGMRNQLIFGITTMPGLVMLTIQGITHGGMAMRTCEEDDGSAWNGYYDDWTEDWQWEEAEEVPVDEQTTDPTEVQYKEAFALASEAIRTLNEAREAVHKIRAARGYFAPESASALGLSKLF